MHPSGRELYVDLFCVTGDFNCSQVGAVAMLDTATNGVRTTVPVDHRPQAMALDGPARRLYVTHGDASNVALVKLGCAPKVRFIPTTDATVGVAIRDKKPATTPRAPCHR